MDLPVIETPIFQRWVWIGEVAFSHIPIATLITAFLVLAPIYEYIGYRTRDLRYDRLARSMVFFVMILYSPGAALGTGIPMFIIGLWPEFWARWSNLFFWPLMAQFGFFLLDVVFLFFFYHLLWERMQNRKRLHIFFGVLTALFALAIQAVWDGLGSYMTTPGAALPMVNEPVGWSAPAFFNPGFAPLFFHRFFGNISYAMLLTGGVFALRQWRQKDPHEKAYFGFAADLTFTVGFLTFFAFTLGGFVRERSRQPYNVYKQLVKVDVLPAEADRFLVYDKCIGCHHKSLSDITRAAVADWERRVEMERQRPGAEISAEEAARIGRYLREAFP